MKRILILLTFLGLLSACSSTNKNSVTDLNSNKGFVYLRGINKNGSVVVTSPVGIVRDAKTGDVVEVTFELDNVDDVNYFNVMTGTDGKQYRLNFALLTMPDQTVYTFSCKL